MKLFITSGIVVSLAAFSGAQQVKPSARQAAQASENQSVKDSVVPPLADIAKSTAAVKKEIKKKKTAAPVKSVDVKPAAAPAPAKPAEIKPAAAPVKAVEAKPAAAPAKPVEAVKPAAPGAPALKPAQPRAEAEKAAAPVAESGGGFAVTRKHFVVKGETLWDLSSKYYKDPFKWGRIYTGNLDKISDPDRIYPREEIYIPEITEVIRPALKPETVTDMEAPASEEGVAVPANRAAAACSLNCVPEWRKTAAQSTPAEIGTSAAGLLNKEPLEDLAAGMSEEMPIDLKEWSDSVKIAPGGWDPDGVITGIMKSDTDALPGSLTVSGEMVSIKAYKKGVLKPGQVVTAYMKGAVAVGKDGEKLGRELQKTGILEVVSVDGSVVQARVIDAVTSVGKDQLIVK